MARTKRALEQLALVELRARDPRRLSDGQQQLVAVAGLLAMRPRTLILDEPAAHLDARATDRLLEAVAGAAGDGTAVLIADHDSGLIARSCSDLLVMADGQVARRGPAGDVLADPATWTLGVAEPAQRRLERLIADVGVPTRRGR
jgi:energy-coupling factor transporter ATP-binding protein EcfA2